MERLDRLPKCFGKDCVTISYAIIGTNKNNIKKEEPWISHVVNFLARENDLELDKDIEHIPVSSPKGFNDYLLDNMNKTTYAILFCVDEWVDDITSEEITIVIPCKPDPKFPQESGFDTKMYAI